MRRATALLTSLASAEGGASKDGVCRGRTRYGRCKALRVGIRARVIFRLTCWRALRCSSALRKLLGAAAAKGQAPGAWAVGQLVWASLHQVQGQHHLLKPHLHTSLAWCSILPPLCGCSTLALNCHRPTVCRHEHGPWTRCEVCEPCTHGRCYKIKFTKHLDIQVQFLLKNKVCAKCSFSRPPGLQGITG